MYFWRAQELDLFDNSVLQFQYRCCEHESWTTRNTWPSTEHYFRVRWNRHVTSTAHSVLSNVIAVGNDCYIHGIEPYSRWWSLN